MKKIIKNIYTFFKRAYIRLQILIISDMIEKSAYLDLDKKHEDFQKRYDLHIKLLNTKYER